MSLINQMLQDLERRSSGLPASTKFEPAKSKSLGTDQEKPKTNAFLKVTGTLILLYCAVFLWVKNPDLFKLFNKNSTSENLANQTAPQPVIAPPEPQPAPQAVAQAPSVPASAAPSAGAENNAPAAQTTQDLAQQEAPAPAVEKSKTPVNKITARAKATPSESIAANEEAIPMAVAVAPQSPEETKKAEMVAAEFKKSKLRQPNSQAENGFSKIESAEQKSGNLFNRALNAFEQGRIYEAQAYLNKSIQENPANEEARQTLAALLVDNKKISEAQEILSEGLKRNPKNVQFRMAIARMQLESGDKKQALDTLVEGLSAGRHDASYQSFLANLFQRDERHDEAAAHFSAATQLRTGYPNDYVGLGISLQALQKYEDARIAYSRALSMDKLSPELKTFVDQQMSLINQTLAFKD